MSLRRFKPVKNKWRIAAITALTAAILSFAISEVETKLKTGSWGLLAGIVGYTDPYPNRAETQVRSDLTDHLNTHATQARTAHITWNIEDCSLEKVLVRTGPRCTLGQGYWQKRNWIDLRLADLSEITAGPSTVGLGQMPISIPITDEYVAPFRRLKASRRKELDHRLATEKVYDLPSRLDALDAAIIGDPDIDLLKKYGEQTTWCKGGERLSPPSSYLSYTLFIPAAQADEAVQLIRSYIVKACSD